MRIKIVFILIIVLFQLQACAQKDKKTMKKLIYVMDPQCGWCYGNTENMNALLIEFKDSIDFELLVGGMWLGSDAPVGGEGLSNFMKANGPRMSATTGAELSPAFYELAKDSTYAFSSLEGSAAIVLIKELYPEKVFEFSKAIQNAIFVKGERLDKWETYEFILNEMNLETTLFQIEWMKIDNITKTEEEFKKVAPLVNGFPALFIQERDSIRLLASGYFDKSTVIETVRQTLNNEGR